MVSKINQAQANLIAVEVSDFNSWLENQTLDVQKHIKLAIPTATLAATACWYENDDLFGVVLYEKDSLLDSFGNISKNLPKLTWNLQNVADEYVLKQAIIFAAIGNYQYGKYKQASANEERFTLITQNAKLMKEASAVIDGVFMTRDLINCPASDMLPSDLVKASVELAESYHAKIDVINNEQDVIKEFPALWAVGKASDNKPAMININWQGGDKFHLTLVGKGICFDSGGLNIKGTPYMRNMKKDMGGAANCLGLAKIIMEMQLPIRLTVIIAAAENAISGNAMRPGDIINSRSSKTIEIGNTDAEGRVVLADALDLACEDNPDLIIDMATLTGAARVALGAQISAIMSDDLELTSKMVDMGNSVEDYVWPLPLFKGYENSVKGAISDLNNAAESMGGYAGAITAGLFLKQFVKKDIKWMHCDIFAWNNSDSAGKPKGGDATGIRAIFEYVKSLL